MVGELLACQAGLTDVCQYSTARASQRNSNLSGAIIKLLIFDYRTTSFTAGYSGAAG